MANKITVVLSQGQSANPVKRRLEEELVGALLMERGLDVTVVPHLYDLKPDGTGMLALQNISGDMIVLSWLFPRAAFWTLDRNGILGQEGQVLLVDESSDEGDDDDNPQDAADDDKPRVVQARPKPQRRIYCIDLRARAEVAPFVAEIKRIRDENAIPLVSLGGLLSTGAPRPAGGENGRSGNGVPGNGHATGLLPIVTAPTPPAATPTADENPLLQVSGPLRIDEQAGRRWYPVIDYSRCTNCMECIDFCLFGVYGVDGQETILVEQPDNCRKGCPACSRVCPENAIIFPQHKSPAIAGSNDESAGALKIDLSKLFGAPDGIDQAVLERDVELMAAGREAVGKTVGVPKRQTSTESTPKDDLDKLMDQLDDLEL